MPKNAKPDPLPAHGEGGWGCPRLPHSPRLVAIQRAWMPNVTHTEG